MRLRVRSYLMAGIGIVAAGSIAIPPSVAPPSRPAHQDAVALTAHTAPVNPLLTRPAPELAAAQAAAELLPPEAFTSTATMTATLDTASAQLSALALPGLENAIIAAYDVIMPWVDWGVNLGIYATQWIPIVNWFTPQISIFYYSLIRPIITSATFNIAYWVGGAISFGQGLTDFFNDTVNAGIGFVNAEIDWLLSFLPPFPPFPPFFSSFAAQRTMEVMGARTAVQVPAGVGTALADPPADGVTDDESSTPAGEEIGQTPRPEPETPDAEEPGPAPVQTDPVDGEPQQPVETPTDDTTDGEGLPAEDVEQDLDLDTEVDTDVEDTTTVDAELDSEQPDGESDGPGPDPQTEDEPAGNLDSKPDNKPDSTPDTKNESKPDTKPDTKNDSGSGSEQ